VTTDFTIYGTGDVKSQFTNMLLYGLSGAGKTPLASTAPNPIIFASEPGLKSLQRYNLPYIPITTHQAALDAATWAAKSKEAKLFQTIFFDSVSALSENILISEKRISRDPRKFSPETTAKTMEVVLKFLEITNKHVVMTCKATEIKNDITGEVKIEPFCVVPKLGPQLPYHFDVVAYLSRHRNEQGEFAALRCRSNDLCTARNRGGLQDLDLWEPADLSHCFNKLNGVVKS
jgi:hypothetical protein